MQYDKYKIYFKNNEDMIIKNKILNNYSNINVNVKPAVITNQIKKEYIYAAGIAIVIIILMNK